MNSKGDRSCQSSWTHQNRTLVRKNVFRGVWLLKSNLRGGILSKPAVSASHPQEPVTALPGDLGRISPLRFDLSSQTPRNTFEDTIV